ncbi:MAG TPA: hypothetical protein VGE70_10910 [Burkholderiaceae bacterium]
MATPPSPDVPVSLTVTHVLAQLMERLDHSAVPVDAHQYRSVAARLADALRAAPPGAALSALLETHPAAAELYENLNYQHAGLCRSPLDRSLAAETGARELISKARQHPEQGTLHGQN